MQETSPFKKANEMAKTELALNAKSDRLDTIESKLNDLNERTTGITNLANSVQNSLTKSMDESQKAIDQALALQQTIQTASLAVNQLTDTLTHQNTKTTELAEQIQTGLNNLQSQLQTFPQAVQEQADKALQESVEQIIQTIIRKIHSQFTQEFSQEALRILRNLLNEQMQSQIQSQVQTIVNQSLAKIEPINNIIESLNRVIIGYNQMVKVNPLMTQHLALLIFLSTLMGFLPILALLLIFDVSVLPWWKLLIIIGSPLLVLISVALLIYQIHKQEQE